MPVISPITLVIRAEGSNYGIEVEFNWLATDIFSIYGSVGLLNTSYDTPLSMSLNSRDQAHAPAYQFALGTSLQVSEKSFMDSGCGRKGQILPVLQSR